MLLLLARDHGRQLAARRAVPDELQGGSRGRLREGERRGFAGPVVTARWSASYFFDRDGTYSHNFDTFEEALSFAYREARVSRKLMCVRRVRS